MRSPVAVLLSSLVLLLAACAEEVTSPPQAVPARPAAVAVAPGPALAAAPTPAAPVEARPAPETCKHGVKSALCARCNPKLAAAFKAKGDWCSEHERPESQCAICNEELARAGVK